jgi:hypothetical protein
MICLCMHYFSHIILVVKNNAHKKSHTHRRLKTRDTFRVIYHALISNSKYLINSYFNYSRSYPSKALTKSELMSRVAAPFFSLPPIDRHRLDRCAYLYDHLCAFMSVYLFVFSSLSFLTFSLFHFTRLIETVVESFHLKHLLRFVRFAAILYVIYA